MARIKAFSAILVVAATLAGCSDPRIIEASFDDAYKSENAGTVRVVIPAAYELAQIAYALAESQDVDQHRTWDQGAYYQEMLEHFEPHRSHPAVTAVRFEKWPDYWSYRQNSIAYAYSGGKLKHAGVYETLWDRGEDKFAKVKDLLEDFAAASEFDVFHTQHRDYYISLEQEFTQVVDPKAMQDWLHKNFTAHYDSYLIVISPLVGGAHNFAIVRDVDYAEALITISASNIYDEKRTDDGALTDEAVLKFSRTIFTELDHNYVNPASENYDSEIKRGIGDVSKWNNSDDYRTAEATFNEYVTWAIFPLFVKSAYGDEYVEAAVADVDRVMVKRGFVKFPAFNAWVLSNFSPSEGNTTVEAAYPQLIDWFARQ